MDLWSLFDFLMPGFLGTERQVSALCLSSSILYLWIVLNVKFGFCCVLDICTIQLRIHCVINIREDIKKSSENAKSCILA